MMRMLGLRKPKPTPEILPQAPLLPLEQKPSGNAKTERMQQCLPLLKSNAFAPDVKPAEVVPVEHSLEQLVAIGKKLCEEWGIGYIRGVENKDVWGKLLTERDSKAQLKKYYQTIQNNLAIALDYFQDNRVLLSLRKTEMNELLEALSVCPSGIYDRLESLAISKKTHVTLAGLLSAFRLEIVEGIAMEACKYYSNATYDVYKTSYSPHMRILFKQYAADENLYLPLTGDVSDVNDTYYQEIMHKWFFTNDKINPRDYFNQQFTAHYNPLNLVNRLVEQLVDAIKNTFLDEPQLRSAADSASLERMKPYVYSTPAVTGGHDLHYCITIDDNTFIVALEKKELLDLYEPIKQKAIDYVLNNSIELTDAEKKALLDIAFNKRHAQNLEQVDFLDSANYTRFALFRNKLQGLPLVSEYPEQWHLFYNEERDEENVAPKGYSVKGHTDLRIAIMQLFGEQLFTIEQIQHEKNTYILLQDYPELSYHIDELGDVKPLLNLCEVDKTTFLEAVSFATLQRLKLTALVPLSSFLFIHLLAKNHLDFSSAIIQGIDFTLEPFENLAIDCLCLEKSCVTFENTVLSAKQWSALHHAGRTNFSGITCLEYQSLSDAIKAKNSTLALDLLAAGVDPNYKDNNQSMLWLAIENNLEDVVDIALTVNLKEATLQESILNVLTQRSEPFYQHILHKILGHYALKRWTLGCDETQNNALHFAVLNDYHDFIPLLCQKGANILYKNKNDESPLDLAINSGKIELVTVMLEHSSIVIDITLKNSLLCRALKAKNSAVALYLLSKGADANYKDNHARMLWLAIDNNLEDVVNTVLNGNVEENTLQDCILGVLYNRPKPFYHAILRKMLEHDALKKLTLCCYKTHNNALHLAVLNDYHDFIPLLCQKGVDILYKNKSDKSPLDLAINSGKIELVTVILEHSSTVIDMALKNTLLCTALKAKNSAVALYLLSTGADANYKDNDILMLWLAIKNDLEDVVSTILTGNVEENTLQDSILGVLYERPKPFYHAILRKMLEQDALKKLTLVYHDTHNNALHLAVLNDYHDFIPLLCQKGADILYKNKNDESPLDLAICLGKIELVKVMLEHSSIVIDMALKNSLLCTALKAKNSAVALYLLSTGADANYKDNDARMLWLAIENNLEDVVNTILTGNVDENTLQEGILGVLYKRPKMFYQAILRKMLEHNALNELTFIYQRTHNNALHLAVLNDYHDFIPLLCQKGADILFENKNDESPLDLAIHLGKIDLVTVMLEHSSIEIDSSLKNTLLCKALKAQNSALASYLLFNGADLNFVDDGSPMLLLAINNKLASVVDAMLMGEVEEITLQQSILFVLQQQTSLSDFYISVLKKMLDHGALRHAVYLLGANEDTALHVAVRNRHAEAIVLLCRKGANVFAKNQQGLSSLQLALNANQFDFVECMFLEPSTQITRMNLDIKNKLLLIAIQIKRSDLVLFLLNNGADLNFSDGYSTLWHAITNNLPNVVDAMLKGPVEKKTLLETLQLLLQKPTLEAPHEACLRGILNHDLLKTLHDQMSINRLSWALQAAITNGHNAAIRLLCQNGANVFMKNKFGDCALDLILNNNDIEALNTMLECSLMSSVKKDDVFDCVANVIKFRLNDNNHDHIIEIVAAVIQKFIFSTLSNQTQKAYITLLKDTVFKYLNRIHSLFFITLDNKVQTYLLIVNLIRRACFDTKPDLRLMLEGMKDVKTHYDKNDMVKIYGQFFSPSPIEVLLQNVIEEGETMLANN